MARNIVPIPATMANLSGAQPVSTQPTPQPAPVRATHGILTKDTGNVRAVQHAHIPHPPRYRVTVGGWCQLDKCRVPIRAGKIVDETQYDINELKAQGISLEPLDAPEPAVMPPPIESTLATE